MNKKRISLITLVVLILIQFIPMDKSVPEIIPDQTFKTIEQPPESILAQLKSACYDCHSYETVYPWYTSVAPLSFWINGHIRNGRKALNFSTWGSSSEKEKQHLLYECGEEIAEGHMPPKGYYRMHSAAYLDDAKKVELEAWFDTQSQ